LAIRSPFSYPHPTYTYKPSQQKMPTNLFGRVKRKAGKQLVLLSHTAAEGLCPLTLSGYRVSVYVHALASFQRLRSHTRLERVGLNPFSWGKLCPFCGIVVQCYAPVPLCAQVNSDHASVILMCPGCVTRPFHLAYSLLGLGGLCQVLLNVFVRLLFVARY
jgi:hypothetical protein